LHSHTMCWVLPRWRSAGSPFSLAVHSHTVCYMWCVCVCVCAPVRLCGPADGSVTGCSNPRAPSQLLFVGPPPMGDRQTVLRDMLLGCRPALPLAKPMRTVCCPALSCPYPCLCLSTGRHHPPAIPMFCCSKSCLWLGAVRKCHGLFCAGLLCTLAPPLNPVACVHSESRPR
jgi:hypothetical protein